MAHRPGELYIWGSDGSWFPNIPADVISATDEPGVYKGAITFVGEVGDLHFTVFKRLGPVCDYVNATRLTPYSDGDPANLDENIPAFAPEASPGAWLFTGEPGTYDIEVDLTQGSGIIRISAKSATGITATTAAPAAKTYYYDLQGRFLGNVEPQKGVYIRLLLWQAAMPSGIHMHLTASRSISVMSSFCSYYVFVLFPLFSLAISTTLQWRFPKGRSEDVKGP